jgi:cytochrome c oxidase cbb3-type subunit 4
MDPSLAHSIWTVMMLLLFIGIVIWAWSGKRKQAFREAAHLPFEDDEPHVKKAKSEEKSNG